MHHVVQGMFGRTKEGFYLRGWVSARDNLGLGPDVPLVFEGWNSLGQREALKVLGPGTLAARALAGRIGRARCPLARLPACSPVHQTSRRTLLPAGTTARAPSRILPAKIFRLYFLEVHTFRIRS